MDEELTEQEKFDELALEEIQKASYTFATARTRIRELAIEFDVPDTTRAVKIAQVGIMEGRYKNEINSLD
jgi:hypothetical protein